MAVLVIVTSSTIAPITSIVVHRTMLMLIGVDMHTAAEVITMVTRTTRAAASILVAHVPTTTVITEATAITRVVATITKVVTTTMTGAIDNQLFQVYSGCGPLMGRICF